MKRHSATFVPQPPVDAQPNRSAGSLKRQATDLVARSRASRQTGANQPAAARQLQLEQLTTRLRKYKTFAAGATVAGAGVPVGKFNRGVSPTVGPDAILKALAASQGSPIRARGDASPTGEINSPSVKAAAAAASVRAEGGGPIQEPSNQQQEQQPAHRVIPDPIFEDNVFRIWLAENPFSTKDQIEDEIRRRTKEKLQAERAARLRYVRQYQNELAELDRQQQLSEMLALEEQKAKEMEEKAAQKAALAAAPKPPPRNAPKAVDFDAQRSAWEVFQSSNKELPMKPLTPEPSYVEEMHQWVQGGWAHHTHRHEKAALKIQCCFRVLMAKRKSQNARIKRQRVIKAVLQSEQNSRLAWEMAVITSEQEQLSQAAVDSRFRALEYWNRQMRAKIEHRRRAQRRAAESKAELEGYAATRIQAIWRGGWTRQQLREELDPGIVERREYAERKMAATAIQRVVRGVLVRSLIARMKVSSVIVQRCFRRFRAYRELHGRRKRAHEKHVLATRVCAARLIQGFFVNAMKRKWRRLAKHAPEIKMLQKVGRGYWVRKTSMLQLLRRQRLDPAATKIQCCVRTRRARRDVLKRKAALLASQFDETQASAASMITHAVRRYIAIKKVKKLRHRRTAALNIQRVWRGHCGRQLARCQNDRRVNSVDGHRTDDAAVMIQAVFRGHSIRKCGGLERKLEEKKRREAELDSSNTPPPDDGRRELYLGTGDDAQLVIQRFYRCWIRWPLLRSKVNKSACIVTHFIRGFAVARAYRDRHDRAAADVTHRRQERAAMTIQNLYRRSSARTKVAGARQERAATQRELQANEASDVIVRTFRKLRQLRQRKREAKKRQDANEAEERRLLDQMEPLPSVEEDEAAYQAERERLAEEREELRAFEIQKQEAQKNQKALEEDDEPEARDALTEEEVSSRTLLQTDCQEDQDRVDASAAAAAAERRKKEEEETFAAGRISTPEEQGENTEQEPSGTTVAPLPHEGEKKNSGPSSTTTQELEPMAEQPTCTKCQKSILDSVSLIEDKPYHASCADETLEEYNSRSVGDCVHCSEPVRATEDHLIVGEESDQSKGVLHEHCQAAYYESPTLEEQKQGKPPSRPTSAQVRALTIIRDSERHHQALDAVQEQREKRVSATGNRTSPQSSPTTGKPPAREEGAITKVQSGSARGSISGSPVSEKDIGSCLQCRKPVLTSEDHFAVGDDPKEFLHSGCLEAFQAEQGEQDVEGDGGPTRNEPEEMDDDDNDFELDADDSDFEH